MIKMDFLNLKRYQRHRVHGFRIRHEWQIQPLCEHRSAWTVFLIVNAQNVIDPVCLPASNAPN